MKSRCKTQIIGNNTADSENQKATGSGGWRVLAIVNDTNKFISERHETDRARLQYLRLDSESVELY